MLVNRFYALGLGFLFWASACSTNKHGDAPADHGSSAEASLPYLIEGLDHGLLQSPINIRTSATKQGHHEVSVRYRSTHEHVQNLGHTVQLDYDAGSEIGFDTTSFAFKQLHTHTPSEHLVDGVTYPLEVHLVHLAERDFGDGNPHYLVLGLLFKEGAPNPFLQTIIDALPEEEGEESSPEDVFVDVTDLVHSEDLNHYYFYKGSLTTPPFTETVNWLVLKHIFEASEEQILALNSVEGNNARHIQSVSHRVVEQQ